MSINLYLQEQTRGQILHGGHFLSLGLGLEISNDDLPTLARNSDSPHPNFFSFKKVFYVCMHDVCAWVHMPSYIHLG